MQNRKRNSSNTKNLILDAAETLFAQNGFSGTSISMVCALCKYNKSLIFQYFGDKIGLYNAVLVRIREAEGKKFIEILKKIDEQPINNKEQLKTCLQIFIDSYFDILIEAPNLQAILTWEMAEGWKNFNKLPDTKVEKEFNNQMRAFIKKLNTFGGLNPHVQTEVAIISIINMCLAHLQMIPRYATAFGKDSKKILLEARSQVSQLILDGILL